MAISSAQRSGGARLALEAIMKSAFNTTLDALPVACPARIRSFEGEPADGDRLEVLGLCVGRIVEVVKGGDPMIVRVLGTRIGLARVLARGIHLEAAPPA